MPNYKAYVDGSWMAGKIGYGAVIINESGEILVQFSGPVPEDYAAGTRQVAGELVATGKVVQWCQQQGIPQIDLYYDYMGISAWARGEWKAKKPITQRYKDFMNRSGIRVNFHKVKAHSGDRWNDYADQLAKRGANQ